MGGGTLEELTDIIVLRKTLLKFLQGDLAEWSQLTWIVEGTVSVVQNGASHGTAHRAHVTTKSPLCRFNSYTTWYICLLALYMCTTLLILFLVCWNALFIPSSLGLCGQLVRVASQVATSRNEWNRSNCQISHILPMLAFWCFLYIYQNNA